MSSAIEAAGLSLGDLRTRVAALESASGLRRWSRALARDERRGARDLGARCAQRAREIAGERRRMRRLFSRTLELRERGVLHVAGVDEVGVGPLAGPVVAAAVMLPERIELPGLDDSKRLSAADRERLSEVIRREACFGIGEVSPQEIDVLNIYRASLEAMRRAVEALVCVRVPQHLLVDARAVPDAPCPQTSIVRGDGDDASIAAASVVAKVYRDALMVRFDREYAGYGFARHMGYGTPAHLRALRELGPTPIHRRSFAPVAEAQRSGAQRLAPSGAFPSASA